MLLAIDAEVKASVTPEYAVTANTVAVKTHNINFFTTFLLFKFYIWDADYSSSF